MDLQIEWFFKLYFKMIWYFCKNQLEGIITIKIKQLQDNVVVISVIDNGVGLQKDINFDEIDSLGLQLVQTLTEQLDGELSYNTSNKGTEFIIKFSGVFVTLVLKEPP